MKKAGYSKIVVPVTMLLFGCASGRDAAPASPARAAAAAEGIGEADTAPPAAALRQALSEAIDDRTAWDSLHLLVGCFGDVGMRSAEVYGNGVGIWDFNRQFNLAPAEIATLLRTLDEADFVGFADIYGGRKEPDPRLHEKKEAGEGSAIKVTCRVVLSLGGRTKRVAQLAKGEQSAELKRLAEALLEVCRKPGEAGTAAADLTDGLEQVASGTLAPETFQLLLNFKPETAGAAAAGGFLLRLSGRRVTSRSYDPVAGLLEPVGLTLSTAEVAELAGELAGLNLTELPINLFALDYTDLTVEVLDHKRSVQARQFAGMTAATHGERQLDFERAHEVLHQLHLRVLSGGPAHQTGRSG